MKKTYEKPQMSVTLFDTEDIITNSSNTLYDHLEDKAPGASDVDADYDF